MTTYKFASWMNFALAHCKLFREGRYISLGKIGDIDLGCFRHSCTNRLPRW